MSRAGLRWLTCYLTIWPLINISVQGKYKKSSLCLSTIPRISIRSVKAKLRAFLLSTVGGGQLHAPNTGTHWIGSWVGLKFRMGVMLLQGVEPGRPSRSQSLAKIESSTMHTWSCSYILCYGTDSLVYHWIEENGQWDVKKTLLPTYLPTYLSVCSREMFLRS
jgi:hypothetical protein